jgi:integrase
MARRVKFYEGFADKLTIPEGARDVQVFDEDVPGFGIRKFNTGLAVYFVKYNVGKQQRRKKLAKVVRGNLKAMRALATVVLAKARLGTDTVGDEKKARAAELAEAAAGTTLGALVPKYLEAREGELREKSYREIDRYLTKTWASLHSRRLADIGRTDIVARVDELCVSPGKVSADRARVALSGLFSWAMERGHCENNPTASVKARANGTKRSRTLTEAELVQVWKGCRDNEYGSIVRLLILTGQRRKEIGDLGWSEVNFGKRLIDLPGERTKNHRAHVIPLSPAALTILEALPGALPSMRNRDLVFGFGAGGFGGWAKCKAELDKRIGRLEKGPWVLHDLRRTLVTQLSELGVAPHIVEAIVNHVGPHKAGIAGVYNHAEYLEERRKALDEWAEHILALVEKQAVHQAKPKRHARHPARGTRAA